MWRIPKNSYPPDVEIPLKWLLLSMLSYCCLVGYFSYLMPPKGRSIVKEPNHSWNLFISRGIAEIEGKVFKAFIKSRSKWMNMLAMLIMCLECLLANFYWTRQPPNLFRLFLPQLFSFFFYLVAQTFLLLCWCKHCKCVYSSTTNTPSTQNEVERFLSWTCLGTIGKS